MKLLICGNFKNPKLRPRNDFNLYHVCVQGLERLEFESLESRREILCLIWGTESIIDQQTIMMVFLRHEIILRQEGTNS